LGQYGPHIALDGDLRVHCRLPHQPTRPSWCSSGQWHEPHARCLSRAIMAERLLVQLYERYATRTTLAPRRLGRPAALTGELTSSARLTVGLQAVDNKERGAAMSYPSLSCRPMPASSVSIRPLGHSRPRETDLAIPFIARPYLRQEGDGVYSLDYHPTGSPMPAPGRS